MRLLTALFYLILTGCSSMYMSDSSNQSHSDTRPEIPIVADEVIGLPEAVESIEDIFLLTDVQQKNFLRKYNSKRYESLTPSKRIFEYLQNHLSNFNFHSDTLMASEVLSQDLGNCLSLAILTKALANLTKVQIGYQLVETPSVFQKESGILLSSQHVRTILTNTEIDKIGTFSLFSGNIVIDYFPSAGTRTLRRVNEAEFYSMYYSNRAAESMITSRNRRAFWYLKEALKLKPDSSQAINMMGVLHQRLKYYDFAEKIYKYGLKYSNNKLELLSNYHDLLMRQKRFEEAKVIAVQLDKFDNPNPFKWVSMGDKEYHDKNYSRAIFYYRKAAKMANYLHEPYSGIARAQYLLGHYEKAVKAIKQAIKNSHKEKSTALYQKKYELFLQKLEF